VAAVANRREHDSTRKIPHRRLGFGTLNKAGGGALSGRARQGQRRRVCSAARWRTGARGLPEPWRGAARLREKAGRRALAKLEEKIDWWQAARETLARGGAAPWEKTETPNRILGWASTHERNPIDEHARLEMLQERKSGRDQSHEHKKKNPRFGTNTNKMQTRNFSMRSKQSLHPIRGGLRPPSLFLIGTKIGSLLI
jgi:hypothetical protein